MIGPRRGISWGGMEFEPGDAERLLLAGDETAVPAMSRILGDLPADTSGAAFLEVPQADDVLTVSAPAGVQVTWLPRAGAPLGQRLTDTVLAHLGVRSAGAAR